MGVQTAIHIDNLSCYVAAFIGSEIYAHMTDVFRTAVSVNRNIVKENILQNLRNARFVFRCDNKAWSDTVAADFFLAVLECCILMWTPFSGRRAITKRDL